MKKLAFLIVLLFAFTSLTGCTENPGTISSDDEIILSEIGDPGLVDPVEGEDGTSEEEEEEEESTGE